MNAPLPIPTPAVLNWTLQELTAIGHYLPLCGQGDPSNSSSWKAKGCGNCPGCACLPASSFNPHAIDTDSWVSALASYGAKTAVYVVQHGCGFAQWQTRAAIPEANFTYEYSVRYSPWGASGDDVAARFVASCRKFGISPGFYLAVATNHYMHVNNNVVRGGPLSQAQYEQVVLQMLKELWSNYGAQRVCARQWKVL